MRGVYGNRFLSCRLTTWGADFVLLGTFMPWVFDLRQAVKSRVSIKYERSKLVNCFRVEHVLEPGVESHKFGSDTGN